MGVFAGGLFHKGYKSPLSVGFAVCILKVNILGEQWIRECNELLQEIQASMKVENADRLQLVTTMHRALTAVNHSVLGWFQYVHNPDIMSMFDKEELVEITKTLNKLAEAFVTHDIEITEKGMVKVLSVEKEDNEHPLFYV
jgi:hypothetical protein